MRNDRYANKEIKDQIIRADKLTAYIRKIDAEPGSVASSEKSIEELAHLFLSLHNPRRKDYAEKYRVLISEQTYTPMPEMKTEPTPEPTPQILCPKCGADMVKRTTTKGANAGQSFYGCSAFPKCRSIVQCK